MSAPRDGGPAPLSGSYRVESFAADAEAEARRLDAQVDLFWPMESELFARLGLRDGVSLLDCGCGPGRLLELMKRRMPALECVGLEADPRLVEACRKRVTENGLADCAVLQGDLYAPGLATESFDFIVLRLVLEHVPDPLAALKGLTPLLRPGGRIVVISNDFEFHLRTSPPIPELEALYRAYCASRRRDGGDPCIGRRVPALLLQAGLRLVASEIELAHNALTGDAPFLRAEGAGIPARLVKEGFLDEATFEAMVRSWRAMLEASDHSIARPLWVAVGERAVLEPKSRSRVTPIGAPPGREAKDPLPGTIGMLLGLLAVILEREDIKAEDSMAAIGIDSICAIALQERIKERSGVEVPIFRFFQAEPVRKLADYIDSRTVPGTGGDSRPLEDARGETKWEEGEL